MITNRDLTFFGQRDASKTGMSVNQILEDGEYEPLSHNPPRFVTLEIQLGERGCFGDRRIIYKA